MARGSASNRDRHGVEDRAVEVRDAKDWAAKDWAIVDDAASIVVRTPAAALRPALQCVGLHAVGLHVLAFTVAAARAQTIDPEFAAAVALLKNEAAASLAVHITPSGHWQLANAKGEMVTAASADEVRRGITTLRPEMPAGNTSSAPSLVLLLTAEAAGRGAVAIDQLPQQAALRVLAERRSLRLAREPVSGKPERVLAELRPHLFFEVMEPQGLREVLWQLDRKLEPASVRLLSLEPGGARTLPAVPKRDAAARNLLPDTVDPFGLAKALPALKGQKVLIVGRLDKDLLWFQPRSGPEQSVLLQDLRAAAVANDVALVVLDSRLPRQPGERTWTYLKINVPGLEEAMKGATVGDFYNAIASAQGKLVLSVRERTADRVRIEALPLKVTWGGFGPTSSQSRAPEERSAGGILQDLVSGLTGSVVTAGVHMDLRSKSRQTELDRRWLPGLPASVQMIYALLLALGVAAWPTAARWWRRIWPAEDRGEYGAGPGYWAARGIRGAVFVIVFVPLVAVIAFPFQVIASLAGTVVMVMTGRWHGRRGVPPVATSNETESRVSST